MQRTETVQQSKDCHQERYLNAEDYWQDNEKAKQLYKNFVEALSTNN